MTPALLLLGLDAGGSKTALIGRTGDGAPLGLEGPGANLQRDGLERTADTLAALIERAVGPRVDDPIAVCAGVAGAGREADAAALEAALRRRLGARRLAHLEVVHDGLLALEAAFGLEDPGLAVIAGTGSVLLARTAAGTLLRAGGWGERLGDPGSGTALGRAALAAVADAFDGGDPTALSARLADALGLHEPDDLIRIVYADALPLASVAPLVLETAAAGDWIAERILQREANALAQRAAWLAARATRDGGFGERVALLGGLAAAPPYAEVLHAALARHLPEARLVAPAATPAEAALARAGRLVDAQTTTSGG